MKTDLYTKIVLTIIAIALCLNVVLEFQPESVIADTFYQMNLKEANCVGFMTPHYGGIDNTLQYYTIELDIPK